MSNFRWTISISSSTFWFRTLESTHLDDTLEMNIHRVRELEGLEMSIRHYGSRRSEVLDLVESRHNLWSSDTAVLIYELNWSSFSIMSHAVSNKHVEFVFIVFDSQDHCHCLTDFDYSRHFGCPRSFSDLL